MKYIRIDNDMWADAGKVYFVHEYATRENSTAVTLTIEDTKTGEIETRVVPQNQIEWLAEKD
jgi:mevalonate kinase